MDTIALVIEKGILTDCEGKHVCGMPEGIPAISNSLFSGCTGLRCMVIPNGSTFIGAGAFDGCDELTIHAPAGSYAEGYARANGIAFTAI